MSNAKSRGASKKKLPHNQGNKITINPVVTVLKAKIKPSISLTNEAVKELKAANLANPSTTNLPNSPPPKKADFLKSSFAGLIQTSLANSNVSPIKKKQKHKLIRHCADEPYIDDSESTSSSEEVWAYKFMSDSDFYQGFRNKFYQNFKKERQSSAQLTLTSKYSIKQSVQIIKELFKELRLEDLQTLQKDLDKAINIEEERRLIESSKKVNIQSIQYTFEYCTKLSKKKLSIQETIRQIPTVFKTQFVFPEKPFLGITKAQNLFLRFEYDRENRLYRKEEMMRFRIMNCYITIDKNGVKSFHPPGYQYETENVLKINVKHLASYYVSEGKYHERCEQTCFPINKVKTFKLIDIAGRNTGSNSTQMNSERLNKPALSQFSLTSYRESVKSSPPKTEIFGLEKQKVTKLEKEKRELVTILEKSKIVETTKESKLKYFYQTPKERHHLLASSSVSSLSLEFTDQTKSGQNHMTSIGKNIIEIIEEGISSSAFSHRHPESKKPNHSNQFDYSGANPIPMKLSSRLNRK